MNETRPEPDFVKYRAAPDSPSLVWPAGKPVALTVFLHFEHWDLDPEQGLADPRFSELLGGGKPDYATHCWFEYGNRVGIFRVLQALDRFPGKVTVAANSQACRHYPELARRLVERGYEFAAHGSHANHMISSRMSPSEEQRAIASSLATIEEFCGRRPIGWMSQSHGETPRTPGLLAEQGITYVVDWSNDDRPYLFEGRHPLVSLPNQWEFDDEENLYHRKMFPWIYPGVVLRAFDQLARDGQKSGTFFGLHIHPWIAGKPFVIKYLEEILTSLARSDAIWHATAAEVAAHIAGRRI